MCVQVHAVVGVLSDDTDPMVTVMKLEKAPTESYADIGGKSTKNNFCENNLTNVSDPYSLNPDPGILLDPDSPCRLTGIQCGSGSRLIFIMTNL
jgi:hypothetical protein